MEESGDGDGIGLGLVEGTEDEGDEIDMGRRLNDIKNLFHYCLNVICE